MDAVGRLRRRRRNKFNGTSQILRVQVENPNSLTPAEAPEEERGKVIGRKLAREWLYANYLLWAAIAVSLAYNALKGGYDSDPLRSFLLGAFAIYALCSVVVFYGRSIVGARRIVKGLAEPPSVDEGKLNELMKSLKG